MTVALISVDMQKASLDPSVQWKLEETAQRINNAAGKVRAVGGVVIHIQHDGTKNEGLEPFSEGWTISDLIDVHPDDPHVRKTFNDAFYDTDLEAVLGHHDVSTVLIGGWATDFCVDSTVRSAVCRGYSVLVLEDGHTLAHRDHLRAEEIIRHHNWVWQNLIPEGTVTVSAEKDISF